MVESKKGHNSAKISWNSLKIQLGHLNVDLNLYAKYQYHNSSDYKDSVDKVFFIAIMQQSQKGHNLVNISRNSLKS